MSGDAKPSEEHSGFSFDGFSLDLAEDLSAETSAIAANRDAEEDEEKTVFGHITPDASADHSSLVASSSSEFGLGCASVQLARRSGQTFGM
mmetsp:Transcript_31352/g.42383  ORF Transcript_31352/g.42383 Transcript_31352/m.42383 type:complete len:91 (-) Transcript_31352:27-299(-)